MNPKNTPAAPKAKPAATLPVKTFRLGRIKAAVWEILGVVLLHVG